KKQAQLFRCVDIGAELFAMMATCVRAVADARRPGADADAGSIELADVFCRHSRRRIEHLFRDIRRNADGETYRLARRILDRTFEWLEAGIMPAPEAAAPDRRAGETEGRGQAGPRAADSPAAGSPAAGTRHRQ